MNYKHKTREELIKELRELQQEYDSLKTSYLKDITRHKRTEENLHESAMKLARSQKIGKLGSWEWNIVENSLEWSDEVYRIWGVGKDIALTFESIDQMIHPDDRKFNLKMVQKFLADTNKGEFEFRIICPDGTIKNIYQSIETSHAPSGQPLRMFGIMQDITGRKLAEEALHASEEKHRTLIEQSIDGIVISDEHGNVSVWNMSMESITGIQQCETIGRPLWEIQLRLIPVEQKTPELLGQLRNYLKNLLESKMGWPGESREQTIIDVNGTHKVVQDSTFMIKTNNNMNFGTIIRDITARRQSEEALNQEKENFRHSLDDSPLGVRIVTMEGNTIYANQAIINIYGYDSLEEFRKTPLKDRYTSESYIEAMKRKHQRESGDLSATDYEISIVRKNGEIRHLQVYRKEVLWNGVKQFQVIYMDISKRKQAEVALRESEERYSRLMEGSQDAIVVHSKGKIIFVNEAGLKLIGAQSPQELFGKPILDIVHPDSRSKVIDLLRQVTEGKEAPLSEEKFVKFDGSVIDVEVVGIPCLYQGQVAAQAIIHEITKQKQAEAALRESEARFRSLFENSLIGIYTASTDGRLLQANPAYARMYGYENPEMMLAEVADVGKLYANPTDRKKILRILSRNGFTEAKEMEMIRRDGSRFFVLVSACEIRDAEGKLLFNQTTNIDLTERRQMEDELLRSKELLEKLNQRLYEIRENERAVISREIHDELGQSMTALKLDLNRMHEYITNPEAVAKLGSMIELVSNTIKDVQRISSDLRPGILDDLGLATAIEWYTSEFEKRTGIRCSLKLDDSIFGDSQKNLVFFRVLQEALTNVIRHANASSVSIKLHQTPKGMTLTIQDNGIGIHPGKIKTDKALGLIGMRERVRQFNGKVDISSGKGQGTKLTIFIP